MLFRSREDKLAALASTLHEQYGVAVEVIVADLSQPDTPQKIVATCSASDWQVDWLINNAGVAGPDLLKDRDWSEQYAFYQLMMLSVAEMCHLFIPSMVERGQGRVINIASVAARVPRSG